MGVILAAAAVLAFVCLLVGNGRLCSHLSAASVIELSAELVAEIQINTLGCQVMGCTVTMSHPRL